MKAYKRFIEYAKIWTSSEWNSPQEPSSMRQFDLAHQLALELRELGLCNVLVDNYSFVYGSLPATPGYEARPVLGLLAHLDTHPGCSGQNVRPQLIPHYDGSDVPLGDSGLSLRRAEFPHLASLIGQTLITSDGHTLLGVDDKAGIAEIMTALELVIHDPRPHGPVSIAFMPDEEIGSGTAHFNLEQFGAQFAYTVDGWDAGEIVTETFNGVQASVQIQGVCTHTGRGKGLLINAQLAALEFAGMLPPDEIPALTEGREGFFHLLRSCGTVDNAQLIYKLRDFTEEGMRRRINLLKQAAYTLNVRYGDETVQITFQEEYRNMHDKLTDYPQLIQHAENACRLAGIEPKLSIARGGTNGARLSFAGIPCPNLGIGGWAYHSPQEHITVEIMEQVTRSLQELIYQFT